PRLHLFLFLGYSFAFSLVLVRICFRLFFIFSHPCACYRPSFALGEFFLFKIEDNTARSLNYLLCSKFLLSGFNYGSRKIAFLYRHPRFFNGIALLEHLYFFLFELLLTEFYRLHFGEELFHFFAMSRLQKLNAIRIFSKWTKMKLK